MGVNVNGIAVPAERKAAGPVIRQLYVGKHVAGLQLKLVLIVIFVPSVSAPVFIVPPRGTIADPDTQFTFTGFQLPQLQVVSSGGARS